MLAITENLFLLKAISPGLVENDGIDSQIGEEHTKNMPSLTADEVSSAVLWAISRKGNVQVRTSRRINLSKNVIKFVKFLFSSSQIQEIVIKPVGDFL